MIPKPIPIFNTVTCLYCGEPVAVGVKCEGCGARGRMDEKQVTLLKQVALSTQVMRAAPIVMNGPVFTVDDPSTISRLIDEINRSAAIAIR